MKIGWIGLGNMGVPMATNLLKAGHAVSVYNRTKEKAEPLLALGAAFVDSPTALFAENDVIFTMVSDDAAVKEIYTGATGVLKTTGVAGKIAVDMSTVSPQTSRFIAEQANQAGVRFLDAPVSGSVQPAKEGNLIIMVGGDKETFAQVNPLFAKLGKLALHLGDNGAGSSAKLAINLLLGITGQAIAESVLFAREHGIAAEDMLQIINESAVGTGISRMKTPLILQNEYPAAFALKHMAKDLRLAKEEGAASPLAQAAYETFQSGLQAGLGEQDFIAVLRLLQDK
ncbi:NAD(P)-dependent oxidoreductase [Brevibacillus fulvus]|uniref:3-hydroxyisobutyrate dehydrogenase n=1 Tax=Brevibacillus fulvus TaxID=1125967 RepID=A0A938XY70_9BACL|nr:NAD(P)-dependent oxidoreductase [Brevibacillus fulvus]MBM7589813.1 3-hydroxyisobutyrate dehydrogenase [Brevibacillus fulvus]